MRSTTPATSQATASARALTAGLCVTKAIEAAIRAALDAHAPEGPAVGAQAAHDVVAQLDALLGLRVDHLAGQDAPDPHPIDAVLEGELARHRLTTPGFARIATATMFDPAEAARLGYLDRVLDAAALDDAVREEAARLCALHRPSFAATKARANERALEAFRAAVAAELGAAPGR